MAGALKEYDPDQVTVSIFGILADGYADGEFVTIEQDTDDFTDVAGTDGDVTRSKTNDRRGTLTLKLMQSSSTNAKLSGIRQTDLSAPNGAGVGAIMIRDRQGTSLFHAEQAWIAKPPDVSYDREAKPREWKIRYAKATRVDGGN